MSYQTRQTGHADRKKFARKMRRNPTRHEEIAFKAQRNTFANLRVQVIPQSIVGPYIVDFLLSPIGIVVEIDGDTHDSAKARRYDDSRTTYLNGQGLCVLRFRNEDIEIDTAPMLAEILARCPVLSKAGDPVTITKCPPGSAISGKRYSRGPEFITRH